MNLRLLAVVLSVGQACGAVDLTQYVHPLVGTEGAIPGVSNPFVVLIGTKTLEQSSLGGGNMFPV